MSKKTVSDEIFAQACALNKRAKEKFKPKEDGMRKEHYTCDAGAFSIGTFNGDFLLSRHEILNGYGDGTHTVFVLGEDENFPPQNSKIDGGLEVYRCILCKHR